MTNLYLTTKYNTLFHWKPLQQSRSMIVFVGAGCRNQIWWDWWLVLCPCLSFVRLEAVDEGEPRRGRPSKNTRGNFILWKEMWIWMGPQYFFWPGLLRSGQWKGHKQMRFLEMLVLSCCVGQPSASVCKLEQAATIRWHIIASTWVELYHSPDPKIFGWPSRQACLFHSSRYPWPCILLPEDIMRVRS